MVATLTQQFCQQLRRIVALLEQGDRAGAAAQASEMRKLIATLPPEMTASEVTEAKRLLARYAELGEELRQTTLASMARLGAARRAAVYGRRDRRP